jgi:hypothetical protein
VFALVRIVHRVNPEELELDKLAELYAEANFYERIKAKMLAEELAQILNR